MLPPASGHNRVGANVIRKICKTFVLVPQKGLFYYSLRKRSTYEESWNNNELSLMPDQYDKNKYIFWRTLITVKKGWNHLREDFKKKRQRKWHCAKRGGGGRKKSNFECIIKSDILLREGGWSKPMSFFQNVYQLIIFQFFSSSCYILS